MSCRRALRTFALSWTFCLAAGCEQAAFGNALDPASGLGAFLSMDPFQIAGTPSLLLSNTPASVIEGSNASFTLRFTHNVPAALAVQIRSSTSGITIGGSQTGSLVFPFGGSASEHTVTLEGALDSNATSENTAITLTSAGVDEYLFYVLAKDTDVDFTAGPTVTLNLTAYSVALGDLDGDGKIDIVGGSSSSTPRAVRNTSTSGSISFAASQNITMTGSSQSYPVLLTDFDGDGKLDVAATSYNVLGADTVGIARNNSAVGTIAFVAAVQIPAPTWPQEIAAGDFDGDGKPDLVIADFSTGVIALKRNTTAGAGMTIAFADEGTQSVGGFICVSVATADIDGDGKIDIITGDSIARSTNGLVVFRNTSASIGTFAWAKHSFSRSDSSSGFLVRVADIDLDGKPDVIVSGTALEIYRNTSTPGSVSFAPVVKYSSETGGRIALGDLNGSGLLDVIHVSNNSRSYATIYRNISKPGNVDFRPPFQFTLGTNTNQSYVAVGDMDLDGKTDFVYTNNGTSGLIYANNRQ